MKKRYFAPSSDLVKFEVEGMIAASQEGLGFGDGTADPGTTYSLGKDMWGNDVWE